ncbi:MAG TPA: hypothetical protein VLR93_07815 [Patescibacteria group bacterium]|nr:hypothetical protein [Patescibacteria group bacterium]
MTTEVFPRPLTESEHAILDHMLAVDDARLEPLRRQATTVTVVGRCSCGCASIELEVDRLHASRAVDLCSPVTETSTQHARDYPDPDYRELILFLDDGWLSYLEIVFYIGDAVREFPPADRFGPAAMRC